MLQLQHKLKEVLCLVKLPYVYYLKIGPGNSNIHIIIGSVIVATPVEAYRGLHNLGYEVKYDGVHEGADTALVQAMWVHLRQWMNTNGGTRRQRVPDAINEYMFHRNYLKRRDLRMWKMLVIIGKHGMEALEDVSEGR